MRLSRRLLPSVLLLIGWLALAPVVGAATIKLLTIGNSFADNATRFLPQIAKSQGSELILFKANLPAADLARHAGPLEIALANPQAKDGRPYATTAGTTISLIAALEKEKWDFVTLQQWSMMSFDPSTYEPAGGRLVRAVREHAPSAEILVHQTWAYRADDPWFTHAVPAPTVVPNSPGSPEEMYRRLKSAYDQFAARYDLRLLPVGDAFERARVAPRWTFAFPDPKFDYQRPADGAIPDQPGSLNVGWTWHLNRETGKRAFGLDAHHANVAGCYLAGCVWLEIFTGRRLVGEVWRPEALTDEQAASLRSIAHEAIAHRYPPTLSPAPSSR